MFERFTPSARQSVVHAQEEAGLRRHNYIGTEHLLLGILREPAGRGARVLHALRLDLPTVRSDVESIVGGGPSEVAERDAEALRAIGIDVEEVRRRVEEAFGPGSLDPPAPRRRRRRSTRCEPVPGRILFAPRAKKVLELSLREARALGNDSIGTEHILLGLAREGEGVAAQILEGRGAHARDIRRLVAEEIGREKRLPGRSA